MNPNIQSALKRRGYNPEEVKEIKMEDLLAQIKVVKQGREDLVLLKKQRDELYEMWKELHQELLGDIELVAETVSNSEETLRELTIKAYEETGSKKPAEGVGIREVTSYIYDPQEAFGWALEHKMALKLDDKAFKDIAKATPLPFVTTETTPQATISTTL